MKCPKCQFENPETRKFCRECGTKLVLVCPQCRFENLPGDKFCGECGHDLGLPSKPIPKELSFEEKLAKIQRYLPDGLTKKILAQKGRIEGERRQVTIMFCDMKGFTPLTYRLGPEEAFELIDRVLEILILKVHQYEGTVNDVRGDGIMALFGALDALEDAPLRAIRASVAIHKGIAEFSEEMKDDHRIPPILLRIGINTGTVVIGTVGIDLRVQFTLVGDTINMASRMEALAEPGTTYVTEETYRLTKDLFHFQPLGKKMVKGKEEPIPVYKVLSAKDDVHRARLGSERRIYSRMVGRDSELNRLELQVMKAINGEGSVVNIIGEAGIGKSRLVAELKRREVMKRVTLLEGRAISIGKNLSFHPIIDLSKQWVGIRGDDGEAKAFDKLEAAIKRLFPEEYGEVLPFVATLMGMKLSGSHAQRTKGIEGEALKRLILKSVRDLLVKATELTPLVIVIEDLHWADTSSVELMESLFRLAETHKILFINLFRPGYKETGDRLAVSLKDKRHVYYYVEIVLEPLAEKTSEALISSMLNVSKLQHAIVTSIVERTGGNPFFIEEVVRSLIDEQALLPKEGTFHLTNKAATISIPKTIDALLTARIDRLEEQTRDLVKEASVIGRSFFYRILAEVASEIEDIDVRLSYLQEIQLLRERLRMGELEYLFNHALVQEVAYASILPLKRKELHLSVARSIEKIFDERLHEFYGMLAYHYSRAESLEKAEECLIKAGEEALKSSASNEALHYYQEALSIYRRLRGDSADPEKIAMLEKNIGLALFNRGHYAEAVEHFDKALNYYWGELPKNALSRALRFLSSFITFILALYFPSFWFKRFPTQQDTEAVDLFYKKAEALIVINPKRFFIETFFYYDTIVHFDLTRFKFGIGIFAGASALFSFTGLSLSIGRRILDYAKPRLAPEDAKQWILYDLLDTTHLFLKGQWNKITECNEDLVNRNLRIGEMWYASQHYYWHGLVKIYQGYFDAARLMVTKLSEIAEAYENDIYRLLKYLLNINLLIECRHIKEATAEVNRGIDLVQRNGWALSTLNMLSLKASIHLLMKEMEEAGKSLDQANQIRSEVKAVPIQLSAFCRSQFEYYLRRLEDSLRAGRREGSSEYRRNAFKSGKMLIKTCQKAALYRTESYRLMGVYNWLIHDQKSAFKWWHKAISEGESLGARPQLSRTYAEMGMRLCAVKGESSESDVSRAEENLQKAKTMFRDLGLHHDLEDLNSVISRMGPEPSEV
ncbi:MAG: adenylate/guanylate cyclase domain-containing protein [Thermodesulfobacteriota bacterium]